MKILVGFMMGAMLGGVAAITAAVWLFKDDVVLFDDLPRNPVAPEKDLKMVDVVDKA